MQAHVLCRLCRPAAAQGAGGLQVVFAVGRWPGTRVPQCASEAAGNTGQDPGREGPRHRGLGLPRAPPNPSREQGLLLVSIPGRPLSESYFSALRFCLFGREPALRGRAEVGAQARGLTRHGRPAEGRRCPRPPGPMAPTGRDSPSAGLQPGGPQAGGPSSRPGAAEAGAACDSGWRAAGTVGSLRLVRAAGPSPACTPAVAPGHRTWGSGGSAAQPEERSALPGTPGRGLRDAHARPRSGHILPGLSLVNISPPGPHRRTCRYGPSSRCTVRSGCAPRPWEPYQASPGRAFRICTCRTATGPTRRALRRTIARRFSELLCKALGSERSTSNA